MSSKQTSLEVDSTYAGKSSTPSVALNLLTVLRSQSFCIAWYQGLHEVLFISSGSLMSGIRVRWMNAVGHFG